MRRFAVILMLLTGGVVSGVAEEADSTALIDGEELVVTGSRGAESVRHLSQNVTVIDRSTIEMSHQSSVLTSVSEHVPGLFVTQRGALGYAVSTGAAGNISLRGLTGSSGQMMVMVDGHPQYAGIMGHPIADGCQSLIAERVEVLSGPASMLYGSNAMGGVINIVTRGMMEDGVKTVLRAGYGAYNTVESEVSNQIRKGGFSSTIGASYNRTDGHRADMGFEQTDGFVKLGYDINQHWSVGADANILYFTSHNPGPVDAELTDSYQYITRGTAQISATNNYDRTSGGIAVFCNWGNHWINDGYAEGASPRLYRFVSMDYTAGISAYQRVMMWKGSSLTVGLDYMNYGGNAGNRFVDGPRVGATDTLFNGKANEAAGYLDFRQNIMEWLTINAGIRADWNQEGGLEWVPQAGLAFHVPYNIEMKLSASKGYRNPTFREKYMFPPKNADLKPESLWSYEFSFGQKLLDGRLHYSVTAFYIDGKNIILTLPNPSGAGKLNQNSGHINNAGVECAIMAHIGKGWSVEANYSYLWMKTPVVAAPPHKLYVGGAYSQGRWHVSTGVQYINGLYTSVSPVETQSFVLWNLKGEVDVCKYLGLWIRVENILDQQYEINAGFPMPGAYGIGGLTLRF